MAVASELMQFKYGKFTHNRGEVNLVTMESIALKTKRNLTWAKKYIMHVSGELIYDGQTSLNTRIKELETAYSFNLVDKGADDNAGLLHSDGTRTPHYFDNQDTTMASGIQVDYRSFPRGGPDEYATVRTFHVRLSAIYFDADSEILNWRETINLVGDGGPKWRWVVGWHPTNGTPYQVQQQITPWSTQKLYQTGSITTLSSYAVGNVPQPLFPDYEHREQRVIAKMDPRWQGREHAFYTVNWRYVMESPFIGGPQDTALSPQVVGNQL